MKFVLISSIFFFAMTHAFAGENLKRKASSIHSLIVNSNVKNIAIMKDGLFMGRAGDQMDIQKGVFELLVNAEGHVPRLIKVKISGTSRTIKMQINLQKYGKDGLEVEDNYAPVRGFEQASNLDDLPSLCQTIKSSLNKSSSSLKKLCDRRSLRDDVKFARMSWQAHSLLTTKLNHAKSLLNILQTDSSRLTTESFYWKAEKLFAGHPNDPTASNLLAYSSLLRNDCERVFQIGYENSGYGHVSSAIYLMNGLCKEMEGKAEIASAYYQKALKTPRVSNEIYYHAMRLLFSYGDQGSGKKHLNKCLSSPVRYYPCWELSALYHLLDGHDKKAEKLIKIFKKRTRETVLKLYVKKFSILKKDDPNRSRILTDFYKSNPFSYEIAWNLILEHPNTSPSLANIYGTKLQISSEKMAKTILASVEQTKNQELMNLAFKPFVQNPSFSAAFWNKFSKVLKKQGRCSQLEMIATSLDKATKKELRLYYSVNTRLGECFLLQENYVQSAATFARLAKEFPKRWRAAYNHGAVLERLKRYNSAVKEFKRALALKPPHEYKSVLAEKIEFYSRKK